MKKIKAILALSKTGEFCDKETGHMPWGAKPPCKEDAKHFQEYTKDCVLVMGRGTWDSLPFKLKGRDHIVITSYAGNVLDKNNGGADIVYETSNLDITSLIESLKNLYLKDNMDIVFIGGLKLIEEALPYLDNLSVTVVDKDFGTGSDVYLEDLGYQVRSENLIHDKTYVHETEDAILVDITTFKKVDRLNKKYE